MPASVAAASGGKSNCSEDSSLPRSVVTREDASTSPASMDLHAGGSCCSCSTTWATVPATAPSSFSPLQGNRVQGEIQARPLQVQNRMSMGDWWVFYSAAASAVSHAKSNRSTYDKPLPALKLAVAASHFVCSAGKGERAFGRLE